MLYSAINGINNIFEYKFILLLIVFIGIILVIIELTKNSIKQETKIEYRYVPRTFEEEQNEPVYPSDIYKKMFEVPSIWVSSFGKDENVRELKDD